MKLIPKYFVTTIFVTLIILYLICPDPEIIVKYPSPENETSDIYVDDNNLCYKYVRKETELFEK